MNYKTLYLISGGVIGVTLSAILLYVTLTVSANNSNECAPPQENTIEELPIQTLGPKQEIQPIKESSKCNE